MVRPSNDSYRHVLARVVNELPEEHRQILHLRLIDECKPAEAAQILHMTERQAQVLYFAALRLVRAKLRAMP